MQVVAEGIRFPGVQSRANASLTLQAELSQQTPPALHVQAEQARLERQRGTILRAVRPEYVDVRQLWPARKQELNARLDGHLPGQPCLANVRGVWELNRVSFSAWPNMQTDPATGMQRGGSLDWSCGRIKLAPSGCSAAENSGSANPPRPGRSKAAEWDDQPCSSTQGGKPGCAGAVGAASTFEDAAGQSGTVPHPAATRKGMSEGSDNSIFAGTPFSVEIVGVAG